MKKIILALFAVLLILSASACNDKENPVNGESVHHTSNGETTEKGKVTETEKEPEPESKSVITSFFLTAEKNPGIYEDINSTVSDNTITVEAGLL